MEQLAFLRELAGLPAEPGQIRGACKKRGAAVHGEASLRSSRQGNKQTEESAEPSPAFKDVRQASGSDCTVELEQSKGSQVAKGSQDAKGDFHIRVFGWNVGGCDISDLASAVTNAASRAPAPDDILVLQEMTDFLKPSPIGAIPVVCQCDANAAIRWCEQEGQVMPVGLDGKANEVLGQLEGKRLQLVPPGTGQWTTPTSRPRQQGRQGHIIDYMSVRGIARTRLRVHVDSYLVLGTDHELLEGSLVLRRGPPNLRFSTKPRVWTGGIDRVHHVDQQVLVDLAARCTKRAVGLAYRDPPEVKEAVHRAKFLKSKESWCQVRSLRKQARRKWESERLARASQGDWEALKQCKPPKQSGWEHTFADAQPGDPHTAVHNHLEKVYQGEGVRPNSGVFPGATKGFDLEELRTALGQMKTGKSVGVDGTSAELLKAIAELPGGAEHLLEFMTRTLVTHEIPRDWNAPLMIILAKVSTPLEAKHLSAVESPALFAMVAETCLAEVQNVYERQAPDDGDGCGLANLERDMHKAANGVLKPRLSTCLATRMVALDNDTTGDLSNLSSSGIPETRAEEPTGATRLDMTRVERIYAGSACGHGSRLLRLDPVLPVQARRVRYLREPLKVATALAILYQCQEVVTSEPDGATGVQTKRPPETAMVAEAWNMTLTMGTRQEPEELQAGVRQVMDVQLDRSALGRLADEAGESEVSSFFQTTEPPLRTWAELMDVFWGWFEEGRQVGLAVRMVRRFMQDRDDEGYQLWSESAMGALEAGIPGSSGLAYDLSPPDFYLWATEVETVLYQAFQRDHSRRSEEGRRTRNSETDGEQVDLMERGQHRGEIRDLIYGRVPAGLGQLGLLWPNPPRDNDDCVDIWRHLLGVDSTALPAGLETTSQDGPFIPDVRASYIREVLSGFTAEQQALMTFGLLTAFRALMAELGVVLHAASYVEVVPESTAGDAGGDDADEEDDDGIPTLMLQVNMQLSADYEGTFLVDKQLFADDEGISLVQRDASEVAGILGRLQDALSGPDAGLSRLRAAHLRGRVQGLRLNSFVEAQISDQVEALCVVTESAGENEVARGFHALEDQVAEWSWSWWRMLEPLLLNQPDDPPNAQDTCVVNSSGNGSLHVVGPEPPLDEAQVAALAADQEDLYYRGVEAAVESAVAAQAARDARTWDDWALHDEMYATPRSRKRLCLEITVGCDDGASGEQRTMRVPMEPGKGLQVQLRIEQMQVEMPGVEGELEPSEVSTVPACLGHEADRLEGTERDAAEATQASGAGQEGPAGALGAGGEQGTAVCQVPVEFHEFQQVYEQWQSGLLSMEAVRARYGCATVDLLEAQHIVMGSCGVSQLEQESPAEVIQGSTDTLLDTMLATCQSSSVGSDQISIPGSAEGSGGLRGHFQPGSSSEGATSESQPMAK
ncbi:hypothetical protein AK812_SmicGene6044 [Symbiodinium microadriaticum]|uniref:Endonuclease/exonuclease/phosphatase domain-containing protein n=1 Tax=Symbiodinium microadriaticum TaxID=2951 RepID=A0A1Q9ESC1_SYMMI|nr:hypothetical protein AK812_SmicGene6044 [Symbiodinium microadriaticum]CAE7889723.1 unnamed protein product [Symbiodinium sp. KB8]